MSRGERLPRSAKELAAISLLWAIVAVAVAAHNFLTYLVGLCGICEIGVQSTLGLLNASDLVACLAHPDGQGNTT